MQITLDVDISTIPPAGAGGQLPVSDGKGWLVKIVDSALKQTKKGSGGYIEFELEVIEGEFTGYSGAYRLQLWNPSEDARRIAFSQLSAICHVTGQFYKPGTFDSAIWHNIPFRAVVALQKKERVDDPDYTEVKSVLFASGEKPGKAHAQQPQPQAPQAPQAFAPAPGQAQPFAQPPAQAPQAPGQMPPALAEALRGAQIPGQAPQAPGAWAPPQPQAPAPQFQSQPFAGQNPPFNPSR